MIITNANISGNVTEIPLQNEINISDEIL